MPIAHRTIGFAASAATLVALLTAASDLPAGADLRAPIGGEAVIRPIESDLTKHFWTSVRASGGEASAALAKDGDPTTAWVPAPAASGAALTLDLGGLYDNVRKVEILFPAAGGSQRYTVDASTDGAAWETIADRRAQPVSARGATHLFTRPGTRFLRVRFDAVAAGGRTGIAEIRAYNYLRDDLVLGADLSNVDQFQDRRYYVTPNPSLQQMGAGPHLLDVVQDRGMEFIRLRVWNEPRNERTGEVRTPATQGPERTLQSARWVKDRNLLLGIDFHYADSWADPGKQPKPRAWAQLPFPQLVDSLRSFTHDYVRAHVEQGTIPDKVAVGNEIINGFLWGSESNAVIAAEGPEATVNPPYFREQADIYRSQPGGRILWEYWGSADAEERRLYDESWDRFSTLIAAGIEAVRRASPQTKVELHTIVGSGSGERSGLDKTMEFWDQLLTRVKVKGQEPDVLAISYYAEWHGTVEQLDRNLHTIATTYPQYRVNIAETAYPASGETPQPNSLFPRTVQGQADAIQRVFQAANDVVDNRGVGVLLWEPASFQSMFRAVPGMEGYFEPLASIDVFNRSQAEFVVESTLYLTAAAGSRPALPATVQLLRTADGAITALPVQWETPSAAAGGRFEVLGTTTRGEVRAVVDVL